MSGTRMAGVPARVPIGGVLTPRMERFIRTGSVGSALVIAVSAMVLSYAGLLGLALDAKVNPHLALLVPVMVDGLQFVGSLGVVYSTLSGLRSWYPWALMLSGVSVSAWGNWQAAPDDLTAKLLHASAPVILALVLEELLRVMRHKVHVHQVAYAAQVEADAWSVPSESGAVGSVAGAEAAPVGSVETVVEDLGWGRGEAVAVPDADEPPAAEGVLVGSREYPRTWAPSLGEAPGPASGAGDAEPDRVVERDSEGLPDGEASQSEVVVEGEGLHVELAPVSGEAALDAAGAALASVAAAVPAAPADPAPVDPASAAMVPAAVVDAGPVEDPESVLPPYPDGVSFKEQVRAILTVDPETRPAKIARVMGKDPSYTRKTVREVRAELDAATEPASVSAPPTPSPLPTPSTASPVAAVAGSESEPAVEMPAVQMPGVGVAAETDATVFDLPLPHVAASDVASQPVPAVTVPTFPGIESITEPVADAVVVEAPAVVAPEDEYDEDDPFSLPPPSLYAAR